MASNLDRYKDDLEKLVQRGKALSLDLAIRVQEEYGEKLGGEKLGKEFEELKKEIRAGDFQKDYQRWYTESCALIRQMIPDRLPEFESLYKGESRRKGITLETYTIQDWLMGRRAGTNQFTQEKIFPDFGAILMRFQMQLQILQSVESRFESTLFDIKQLVLADLFDSELDTARELQKSGFFRPAGVVAGVVLEAHLSQACTNHGIPMRKKNPAIADYNDLLKSNNVIDVPQWRFIQRLGDLRNLCGHKKEREPTKEDVSELIEGVERITKTLY